MHNLVGRKAYLLGDESILDTKKKHSISHAQVPMLNSRTRSDRRLAMENPLEPSFQYWEVLAPHAPAGSHGRIVLLTACAVKVQRASNVAHAVVESARRMVRH